MPGTNSNSEALLMKCGSCGKDMIQIHEKLGCEHYSEIRKLLEKNLSGDEKKLFELMEPGMKVEVDGRGKANISAIKKPEEDITADEKENFDKIQDDNMRTEYCKYFGVERNAEGKIISTTKKVPNFTFDTAKLAIITNIKVDKKGLYTLVKTGGNVQFARLTNPYQATIHELWHNIDYLAGKKEQVGNGAQENIPHSDGFIAALKSAFNVDNLRIRNNCNFFHDEIKGLSKPTDGFLKSEQLYYLFDIVEGMSYCYSRTNSKFNSIYASRVKYWKTGNQRQRDRVVAAEFFASIGCVATVGDQKALDLIKVTYLPNSYKVYEEMVAKAIPIAEERNKNGFRNRQ